MGNATSPVKSLHPGFGMAEPPKRQPRRANWPVHIIIRSTRRPRAIVDFFQRISRKEHYNDDKAPPRGRIGRQADAIAKSHNLEALAYILDMARVEADQISKRWA